MFIYIVLCVIGLIVATFFATLDWFFEASLYKKIKKIKGRNVQNEIRTAAEESLEEQMASKRKIALNMLTGLLLIGPIYMLIGYSIEPSVTWIEKNTEHVTTATKTEVVSPTKRVTSEQVQPVCKATVKQKYPLGLLPQAEKTLTFKGVNCENMNKEQQQAVAAVLEALKYNVHISVPNDIMTKMAKAEARYGGEAPSQDKNQEE